MRKPPTARIFNVDELIQLVAQRAGISPAQAALAVSAMLSYLMCVCPPRWSDASASNWEKRNPIATPTAAKAVTNDRGIS